VHSVVSQEAIASDAQKLNVHAVYQKAASGQLLFLGSWSEGDDRSLHKAQQYFLQTV